MNRLQANESVKQEIQFVSSNDKVERLKKIIDEFQKKMVKKQRSYL